METLIEHTTVNEYDLIRRIKEIYTKVAKDPDATYHFETGKVLAEKLGYSKEVLERIPLESIKSFAGVGYHFGLTDLKEGESVLDLGCGSGMDVFYASRLVKDQGRVYGLDMTHQQIEKSINLLGQTDLQGVSFIEGYMDDLPFADNTLDVVISNGAINLAIDKRKVFNEISRVLCPGGRMVVSDIVSNEVFPKEVKCNPNLWSACVAGAERLGEYLGIIESSGLMVEIMKDNPYSFISEKAKGAMDFYGVHSISLSATKH